MSEPKRLQITRRRLPHVRLEGSIYFVTFCSLLETLSRDERFIVLERLKTGDPHYYVLLAAVVMPDHVHVLLKPADGIALSRILKGIKGATARKLNLLRNRRGAFWQAESWDRIVRDEDELLQKAEYILENPIRAGLVEDPWKYEGLYFNKNAFHGRQECLPH